MPGRSLLVALWGLLLMLNGCIAYGHDNDRDDQHYYSHGDGYRRYDEPHLYRSYENYRRRRVGQRDALVYKERRENHHGHHEGWYQGRERRYESDGHRSSRFSPPVRSRGGNDWEGWRN